MTFFVDLVDVDLDVDLVDVDLDVDLVDVDVDRVDVDFVDVDLVDVNLVDVDLADIGLADIDFEVDLDLDRIKSQVCLRLLSFEKCCTTNQSICQMDFWSLSLGVMILTP